MTNESKLDSWERGPEFPPEPISETVEDDDELLTPRSEAEYTRLAEQGESAIDDWESDQPTEETKPST